MNMKKICSGVLLAAACCSLSAADLKLNGVSPDEQGIYTFDFTKGDPTKQLYFKAGTPFAVKPGDYVSIEFDLRVLSDSDGKDVFGKMLAGLRMINQAGKTIHASKVFYVPDSLNELAQSAKRGDTCITLKKPWKKHSAAYVAFQGKEDFSDIPNEAVLPVKGDGSSDAENKIFLSRPLWQDYPAGTKVRQHYWGNEFQYTRWPNVGDWKHCKMEYVSGASKGNPGNNQLWPTTTSAQFQIAFNSYKGRKLKIQFRNLKLDVRKKELNTNDIF